VMTTTQAARHGALRRETGRRVRAGRGRAGLTGSELAGRAAIPRQYVYDLEGGLRVTVRNTVAVAKALHLCLDWLLTGQRCLGAERAEGDTPSEPREDGLSPPEVSRRTKGHRL